MTTTAVTPKLTFKTVSIASERKVGVRGGDKAAVKARAMAQFHAGGFAYGKALPEDAREALADKLEIAVPDLGIQSLSLANPEAARCVACNRIHGLDQPHLSAKITFYTKDKKTYALSDSCRQEIIGSADSPNVAKVLTKDSQADYRTDFPAPVKRA